MPPKRGAKAGRRRPAASRRRSGGAFGPPGRQNIRRGGITGGLTEAKGPVSGQEDAFTCTLRYETTSAFTSTAGAASYVSIKGNSCYHPYASNTDNPGGFQRMFVQYARCIVTHAKVTVRIWGGSTKDEPYRVIIVPCNGAQYAIYSTYTNIAALVDVPHAKQVLFSPGGALPTITSFAETTDVLSGSRADQRELTTNYSDYSHTSATDPVNIFYFMIGYQNMAGTTTTNQQAQVTLEYTCRFFQPIGTSQQFAINKWGNEEPIADASYASLKGASASADQNATLEKKSAGLSLPEKKASAPASQEESKHVRRLSEDDWLTDPHAELLLELAEMRKRLRAAEAKLASQTPQVGAGIHESPARSGLGLSVGPA